MPPPPPNSSPVNLRYYLLRCCARLCLLRGPLPLAPFQFHRPLPGLSQLPLQLNPLLLRLSVRPPPLLSLRRSRQGRRRLRALGRLRERFGLLLVGLDFVLLSRDSEGGGGFGGARGLCVGGELEAALPLGLGGGGDQALGFIAEAFSLPGREGGI